MKKNLLFLFFSLTIALIGYSQVANQPSDILICDDDNDGFIQFDLTIQDAVVLGSQNPSDYILTYHVLQADADTGSNPIVNVSNYTNTSNPQQIYVRLEDANTGSYDTTSFSIEVLPPPSPATPTSLEVCDADNDGFVVFDLESKTAEILNGETGVTITYHEVYGSAELDYAQITSPYNNLTDYNQTIYVRAENDLTGCFTTTELLLVVHNTPVPVLPTPLETCDDDYYQDMDGLATFDLTLKDAEITGGNSNWSVSYFETYADATANIAAIDPVNAYENIVIPQTLYVRVEDNNTGCAGFTTLTIRVNPNPTPQVPLPIELCDEINTGNEVEIFDLTIREADIMNGEPYVLSYYETIQGAEAGVNAISDPTLYTNTTTPQIIYVRVSTEETGCYTIVEQEIIVNPLPEVVAVTDHIVCEAYTDGFANFDLESKTAEVLNGQDPNTFVVAYHETLTDAEVGNNALVSPYTNTSNPQQIFVNITNVESGCNIATVSFYIEVQEGAIAYMPSDYIICDNIGANDGFGQFNLSEFPNGDGYDYFGDLYAEILAGEVAGETYSISFHETQNDADQGINAVPTTYQNIINPQTLYIRVENNNSICYETTQLNLSVDQLPIINLESSFELCNGESLVLDSGLSGADYNFLWSTGEQSPTITVTQANTYTLTAIDNISGCSSTSLTNVSIVDCTDSDDDGVNDDDEDENENGDLDDDDTDDDGIPNYLDDDDDGDNVDTSIEISNATNRFSSAQHPFIDTDGDLIENYLDDDDDGDNVLTIDEDYNNNGDPTDDDTNNNSIPDYLDSAVALSVQDFNQLQFSIYPNPAKDEVNISFSNEFNDLVGVSIIDIQGKLVIEDIKSIENSKINVDVSRLQSGIYFLEISLNSVKGIRKLIIE